MPFTDAVSSISGRNSRASNVSGATGGSHAFRSHPPPPTANDGLINAGVLSMLKTSTDTGDIGALSFNTSRLPTVPRAAHHRRENVARASASAHPAAIAGPPSHHHYAPSQTSRVSSQWETSSTQRRGSLTSMQSMPPSLPPVHLGKPSAQLPPSAADGAQDNRSYSMTAAPPSQPLPRHRSATSLKSQGHEPRHGSRMPPGSIPYMPETRPPYVYPTRLKRPGYRSPSPALSDAYAQGPPQGPPAPPAVPKRGPVPRMPQPPFSGYNGEPPTGYTQDMRYLNMHPPHRTMNSSPAAIGIDSNNMAYRQGPPRSALPSSMAHQMVYPVPQPMDYLVQHHVPPPSNILSTRGLHHGARYLPQPGYPIDHHMHHPALRGSQPPPNIAPVAHQIFHNAARMARQLPQRADTPMTDTGPPSSDPPSSSSAPTSSNPPTPKDHTTIQVVVDPAFIDPALVDLPDSSSEPVLSARYFEYAEGLDKAMDDPDMEVPHPSVPPSGFVQRVKAMLESKSVSDAIVRRENERLHHDQQLHELDAAGNQTGISINLDLHELAANDTPRFTIIEEFDAPAELPASPVRVPELECPEAERKQPTHRITREIIQAELGPSSFDDSLEQAELDTTTRISVEYKMKQNVVHRPDTPASNDSGREGTHYSTHTTPRSLITKGHQYSTSECLTTTSADASLPSGLDYALQFSVPADSTMASDETHSRDPFVLDADTITIEQQHQYVKDAWLTTGDRHTSRVPKEAALRQDAEEPVSSIQPGDDVSRCSAVSPLQTQTLGIDETLRIASESRVETTLADEQSAVDSIPEDTQPPPTPRTPKTYSKSVQLPQSNMTAANTNSTNRLSLPGDLSTIGDTTVNTTTDMVTDVAVRFSLPQTTITIGKPQIIDVSTSSTPDKLTPELPQLKPSLQAAGVTATKRNSVTFADEVAPLNIAKKSEPHRSGQNGGEPPSITAKSIIRRPSPRGELVNVSRAHGEGSTEPRCTSATNVNVAQNRFGSTYLPELREESIEDMSISDHKRSSDATHGSQFPLPVRIAAVKAMQERRLQESAEKAKARRTARQHNRPLAEIRDLPSLNFSRMDLIDKLNEALEVRSVKSMDIVRRREFSSIYCPSPQRPQSTDPLRERYTSFFCKPEDFSMFDEPNDSDESDETDLESKDVLPIVRVQEQTDVEDAEHFRRTLSPEHLLSVATQVNRLSIPSVSGLSERLSELIPGLRNLHNLNLDSIIASERNSIHLLQEHGLARPETVLSDRISAGFRTLAERAEEIVKNGTHDSLVQRAKLVGTSKDLPCLPESASADKVSAINSSNGKQSYLSGSVSAPSDLGKDVARPCFAHIRYKSPATEEEVRHLLPPEMNPITRAATRSMIISQPSSRPWNLEENYPWFGSKVDIDLSVPSQAHKHNSPSNSEVLRGQGTRSLDITSGEDATDTSQGIDIGSIVENFDSTASVTTEQLTGISKYHLRKHSKRSIIGSISKKFGLTNRGTEDDNAITKCFTKHHESRQTSVTHPSHRPGDRYPTSGLIPPSAFNLDEVRSFFSDNSSERERTASFRKRLTHFKGKGKSIRLDGARGDTVDGANGYDAGSMNDAAVRLGAHSAANTYPGVGMSKTEFHLKRFGERLRLFLAKGGDIIRSWSTRSRARKLDRSQDEWLTDSLYSGV